MKVLCGLLRRGLWHDGWHDDFQWYQFSDLFHPNAPLFQLKSMLEPFQGGLLEAIQWHSAVFRIAGILCVLAVGTLRYTPHTHTHTPIAPDEVLRFALYCTVVCSSANRLFFIYCRCYGMSQSCHLMSTVKMKSSLTVWRVDTLLRADKHLGELRFVKQEYYNL